MLRFVAFNQIINISGKNYKTLHVDGQAFINAIKRFKLSIKKSTLYCILFAWLLL